MVIDLVLQLTSQLFEVGGASATSIELGMDQALAKRPDGRIP